MADKNFKKILMGNTHIKILAKSTNENYKELSTEFGIPIEKLQHLPEFRFYVKVGHDKAFRIKGRGGLVKRRNAMSFDMRDDVTVQQLKNYYLPENKGIEEKRWQDDMRAAANRGTETRQSQGNKGIEEKKKKGEPPKDEPEFPF